MAEDQFNLAEYVLTSAGAAPDKEALLVLSDRVERWTYGDLTSAVRGTAAGLLARGLTPGARVLMRLGNRPDFPIAYLGALAAGLVPVPTAAQLTTREVAPIIAELDPQLILRDPDVPCPDDDRSVDLSELRGWRNLSPAPFHRGPAERLGYIVYTSGTSGKPAAVMHAHRAILARRMMFQGWYGLTPQDRVLHAGAFNWTYTLGTGLMDPWTMGATALIPSPGTPADTLPALLDRYQATIFAAAPGVYRQLLKGTKRLDLPHLRHGLSAGEKLPSATAQHFTEATGKPIFEAYGLSECSTFISGCPEAPAQPGTLGQPQPGRQVALVADGRPVPKGEAGTIAVHRSDPGLMLGYLDDPAGTEARFDGDWFLTGDQGVEDAAGQITYLGRNDDMMNAGGFRVSPLEVEASLLTHPGIEAVACTEVQIKQDVSVIAAFYTGPAPIEEAELAAFAETRLARYKQPRLFRHMESLPTNPNGKLQRRALRDTWREKL
ncbi:MAG: class I adenylate-forming enzyme family protein [Sulfitobacter sp.]|nr:class I adenylate-forming enzyme family protein [Sulfitobacter sp.]